MGRKWIYLVLFALALIVLPTGTPEDLVTTVLFIEVFGLVPSLIVALVILLLIALLLPRRYWRKLF